MNLEQRLKALCIACEEAGRDLRTLAERLETLETATFGSLVDPLEEAQRFGRRGDEQGFLEFRESLEPGGRNDWMDLGKAYESGRAVQDLQAQQFGVC
jgi:hypothetical protein